MAQQTINVGAAPNDGTGTPLRTAFQYTNSNFTELYTALGGGSGLPGASTQVIFNDGGTNLAGSAGLVFNKTTSVLGVGTVNAGAAIVSGDLTVDTNTLKVVSSLDFVAIGATAQSFGEKFRINGNYTVMNDGAFTGFLGKASAIGASGSTTDFGIRSENALVFLTNGATEQMRLNSTGLGLGQTPISNAGIIQVQRSNNTGFSDIGTYGYSFAETYQWVIGPSTQANNNNLSKMWRMRVDKPASASSGSSFSIGAYAGYDASVPGNYVPSSGWLDRLIIDNSGNVGIGGSPSTKLHVVGGNARINDGFQLEFGGTTNSIAGSNANNTMNIYTNNVLRVSAKANGQVRFIPLAADPAGAEAGDVYYNSTSNKLKCYNGTTWNDLF